MNSMEGSENKENQPPKDEKKMRQKWAAKKI